MDVALANCRYGINVWLDHISRSQTYSPSPVTVNEGRPLTQEKVEAFCLATFNDNEFWNEVFATYWITWLFCNWLESRKTGLPESAPMLILCHGFAVLRLAIFSSDDLSANTRAKLVTFAVITSIRERLVSSPYDTAWGFTLTSNDLVWHSGCLRSPAGNLWFHHIHYLRRSSSWYLHPVPPFSSKLHNGCRI